MAGGVASDPLLRHALAPVQQPAERARVEYVAQLALRSRAATLSGENSGAWAVATNQHARLAFERRARGLQVVEVLLEVDRPGLHRVLERGFEAAAKRGVFVRWGERPDLAAPLEGSTLLLLCKAAIGKPFPLGRVPDGALPALPRGYHSFAVDDDDEDGEEPEEEEDGKASEDVLPQHRHHQYHQTQQQAPRAKAVRGARHAFVLPSAEQLLLTHVLQVERDPARDDARVVCDVCEAARATLYCEQDDACLCEACDASVHGANKLVRRHVRIAVADRRRKANGKCDAHPTQEVGFFCLRCQRPVCVHCKMVGSHSSGEAASHAIVEIGAAYDDALHESLRADPHSQRRRAVLRDQLSLVDKRTREIEDNFRAAEEAVLQRVQEVLRRLSAITDAKLQVLSGEARELERQLAEIDGTEAFLREQQERATPVQFLALWQRHCELRRALAAKDRVSHFSLDVLPDMYVRGLDAVEACAGGAPHRPSPPAPQRARTRTSGGARGARPPGPAIPVPEDEEDEDEEEVVREDEDEEDEEDEDEVVPLAPRAQGRRRSGRHRRGETAASPPQQRPFGRRSHSVAALSPEKHTYFDGVL